MTITEKKLPNRIFRADTPHDVFCAAIVARRLPVGNDVLAINTDYNKDEKQLPDYLECMMMAASVHEWKAVVNVSALPINQYSRNPARSLGEKFNRISGTIGSIRELRRLLAAAFDISPVSSGFERQLESAVKEIYLNTIQHPEVQAFYKIFPHSRMIHIPHGFDSLQKIEISIYSEFFNYKRSRSAFILDTVKKITFGDDAVPIRKMQFDAAYSFNFPFPELSEQYVIKNEITPELMKSLYNRMASKAQKYFTGLAFQCEGKVAILLTFPDDHPEGYPKQIELDGYVKLLNELITRENIQTILIKPHPRTANHWLQEILTFIESRSIKAKLVVIEDYRYLPVEVVLSAFDNVTVCAGIASSSMRSLKVIYGLRTYYLKNIIEKLFENSPLHLQDNLEWLKEVEGDFIAVD